MNVYKVILLSLLALNSLVGVASWSKPSSTVTPTTAVSSVLFTGVFAFLVVMA